MVFYKIEAVRCSDDESTEILRQEQRILAPILAEQTESLYQKSKQQRFLFAADIKKNKITFGAIAKEKNEIVKEISKFITVLPFEVVIINYEEITLKSLLALITSSEKNSYVADSDDLLNEFGIGILNSRYSRLPYGESILDSEILKQEMYDISNKLLFHKTLNPELDRIYKGSNTKKPKGHPVHYIVSTDDREIRKTVYRILLSALYENNRIKNKRYCFVDFDDECVPPDQSLDALYKSCEGGALVIRYNGLNISGGEFAKQGAEVIEGLCEIAHKYKSEVLTIICLQRQSDKIKQEFLLNFGQTAFVELHEDAAFGEAANNYLKNKAKEFKVRSDKNLIPVSEKESGYTVGELNNIFDIWYQQKLKNKFYPQYNTTESANIIVKNQEHSGTAYEQLKKLIGLDSAKSIMLQILNYHKAQRLFAERGMKCERPSMHMIFTGNPGTAKTTVARLFAQIMKENGLLSKGDFYEVGRSDLVGKYVGHTAPLVKKMFARAKGGVLFIDEAYSLVDDRDGLFGDEAINTIVQEMENNREDTVVIFAGYPDKMEGFLNKNPGLRSRIAYNVSFDDYTADELCEISDLIAEEKGLTIDEKAKQKLRSIFASARLDSDFGNGRYARNIIEKAKVSQANRLVNMDFSKITDKDLTTICIDDIETPKTKEKTIKLGFSA